MSGSILQLMVISSALSLRKLNVRESRKGVETACQLETTLLVLWGLNEMVWGLSDIWQGGSICYF